MTARAAEQMSRDEHIALLARTVHLLTLAEATLRRCPTKLVGGVHHLDADTCRVMARRAQDDLDALLDENAEPERQPRERSVPCQRGCGRSTWNYDGICDDCRARHAHPAGNGRQVA